MTLGVSFVFMFKPFYKDLHDVSILSERHTGKILELYLLFTLLFISVRNGPITMKIQELRYHARRIIKYYPKRYT